MHKTRVLACAFPLSLIRVFAYTQHDDRKGTAVEALKANMDGQYEQEQQKAGRGGNTGRGATGGRGGGQQSGGRAVKGRGAVSYGDVCVSVGVRTYAHESSLLLLLSLVYAPSGFSSSSSSILYVLVYRRLRHSPHSLLVSVSWGEGTQSIPPHPTPRGPPAPLPFRSLASSVRKWTCVLLWCLESHFAFAYANTSPSSSAFIFPTPGADDWQPPGGADWGGLVEARHVQ